MLALLDEIGEKQKEIDQCRTYYRSLESAIEKKREGCLNSEEKDTLTGEIATLNREFEEKFDLLYENLNQRLILGYDAAREMGHEVGHDFKTLWDYMTHPEKEEVDLDRVMRDIDYIKKDLCASDSKNKE